jgi:hypothetical protein
MHKEISTFNFRMDVDTGPENFLLVLWSVGHDPRRRATKTPPMEQRAQWPNPLSAEIYRDFERCVESLSYKKLH